MGNCLPKVDIPTVRVRIRSNCCNENVSNHSASVDEEEEDGGAVIDETNPLDRSMIVSGPSCSGKSHYVTELIHNARRYFFPIPKNILWYYGAVSPHPQVIGVKYKRGLPTDAEVESMFQCIVVLDDLMWESRSSMTVGNLFSRVAHHHQCFIIHITQNFFQAGKVTRSQSLNAHYLVLFKNPRDRQQILYLARQIYPRKENFVLSSFEDATQREYGYLLIDLNPNTSEELRLRTMNEDKQIIVYTPET